MFQEAKQMAKKNLLGGFKFEKLPKISNGLIIPTGNDTRPKQVVQTAPPISEPVRQAPKPKTIRQPSNHNFGKIDVDSQAFTPMTNVVPTIEDNSVLTNKPVIVPEQRFKKLSRKARQRVTHEDLNWNEFSAQPTKQDKILYLVMRGWSLKIEIRNETRFHYATKYIRNAITGKLDKKRLYLGSINRELSEGITVKSKHFSRHNVETK